MVTLENVFNKLRSILRNRFRVALLDETKTATLSGNSFKRYNYVITKKKVTLHSLHQR